MSQDGSFKAPLLHRMAAFEIWSPPLRRRVEDIMRLFIYFAQQILDELDTNPYGLVEPDAPPWIPPRLAAKLVRFPWPGNVRQLRNITRQLIIDRRGKPRLKINPRLEHLMMEAPAKPAQETDPASNRQGTTRTVGDPGVGGKSRRPSQVSNEELVAALAAHDWEPAKAAGSLGLSRPSSMNGQRVQVSGTEEIYLIINGEGYLLEEGISELFTDNSFLTLENFTAEVPDSGISLRLFDSEEQTGARLVKTQNIEHLYLQIEGTKRWIGDYDTFLYYNFNWNDVDEVAQWYVDALTPGMDIQAPCGN